MIGVYAVTSPENVTNTSTTQNITGVYDMSGCIAELTANFLSGGNVTFAKGMPTGGSSKYVTIYEGTWDTCNKIGDAIKETSKGGSNASHSWNDEYAVFVTSSSPTFGRGGNYSYGDFCGIFAFDAHDGDFNKNYGFRVVLIPN